MNELTPFPAKYTCIECGKVRPEHTNECDIGKAHRLLREMWGHIWRLEGCPSNDGRCGNFEERISDLISYPGSSHFPSISSSSSMIESNYADNTPITPEWLDTIFPNETMNGHCLLIDSDGHPIELFLLEDLEQPGVYRASMMQSDPADSIAITGRVFTSRGSVHLLLNALGHFVK